MEMESRNRASKKILLFPWLGFGHISPFLELAKKLSQNNFHVYFCSSSVNLQSLHSKLPKNSSSNSIELVDLKIPSLPELPPHMHTTNGLPLQLMPTLIKAFDLAAPEFSSILHKLNPHLLITDMFQPWAIQLASSLNIPVINFLVAGAGVLSHSIHSVVNHNSEFPFPELELNDHWVSRKHQNNPPEDSNREVAMDRFFRWLQSLELCSDVVLAKSFVEMEGKYLDYLSVLLKKKVLPVGPLAVQEDQGISAVDERSCEILEWLDKKEAKSTVYVSFGSEYYLSKQDREELGHGLEMSGANFIWVVRLPKGEDKGKNRVIIEEGFLERVGNRGLVVEGWAPQLKILSHSSIGGFVSHCGWNSLVEAVALGVPVIALPMQLDQPCNAKLAVATGIGVEPARGFEGNVLREEVAKAIKQVLFEKTGEDLDLKVREISEGLRVNESQTMEAYVAELDQLCASKKD